MENETLGSAPALLAILIALLPLAAGAVVASGRRLAPFLLFAQACAALVFVGLVRMSEGWSFRWTSVNVFGPLSWKFDALSLSLVVLVALLGAALLRYSERYLQAETARDGFLRRIVLTVAFVEAFALSNHLLLHLVSWLGISITVHQLLRHYSQRRVAVAAAKKKFLLSRLGDLFMVTALLTLAAAFGTLHVGELIALVDHAPAEHRTVLAVSTFCLVSAAACKSAQVPLHAWLPETMEAPTPVSALMHAGVVNAGPFLLLRLHPLFAHTNVALTLLVGIGGLTAIVALLVQSVQPSIKLKLAWSTVAQMGFVFLELGLGLFAAAAIHLVAHAAYKAQAFLRSGTVNLSRPAPPRSSFGMTFELLLGVCLVVAASGWFNDYRLDDSGWVYLGILWGMSLAASWQREVGASAASAGWPRRLAATGLAILVGAAVIVVEHSLGSWFNAIPTPEQRGPLDFLAAVVVLTLLFATGVALSSWWRSSNVAGVRAWRIHCLNGLYFSPLTDRWVERVWPQASSTSKQDASQPATLVARSIG